MGTILKKIFIVLIVCIIPTISHASNKNDKIYKVGFYEHKPYYYINEKGEYDGYYHEILELISKDLDIEFEYVNYEFSETVKEVYNGDLDLLLGIHKNEEREKDLVYTDHYIGTEIYGVYTNEHIAYGDLSKLDGLKFSFIEHESNSAWILDFFEAKEINVIPVASKTYESAIKLLIDDKVDATISGVDNIDIKNNKKIYEYSCGPVYIASNKENKNIISDINHTIEKYMESKYNPIEYLQNKYFNENYKIKYKLTLFLIKIILLLIVIFIIISIRLLYPKIKKKNIRKLIKNKIKNNEYLIYYQPIIDPKRNNIIGCEALLRLKDKKLGILAPYKFIKEIEENEMLFDISIWVLETIIRDYELIKNNKNIPDDNFYISMNISVVEIENEKFIEKFIEILSNSSINKKNICLEILESVGIHNLQNVQKYVKSLKEAGFIIAIDDFGVEYSNLDILEKIDFDILKLDKYFIDDIEYSDTRKSIMKFLSEFSIRKNRVIVAEGVEKIEQKNIIKEIENDKFYIQGYIYSKPVSIEDLYKINLQ